MQPSLRTLLTGILDYAGLFPPAKLPLDQALANYARLRQDSDSWMLGRFVLPASRLEELQPFISSLFASGPPLALSVLGRPANNDADFLEGLTLDLEAVENCRAVHGPRVAVEVLETRLPAGPGMVELIRESSEQTEQNWLFPFFEIGLAGDWRTTLTRAVHGCSAVRGAAQARRAGLKLRCGGQEATAFPSVEQVAAVIAESRPGPCSSQVHSRPASSLPPARPGPPDRQARLPQCLCRRSAGGAPVARDHPARAASGRIVGVHPLQRCRPGMAAVAGQHRGDRVGPAVHGNVVRQL